MSDKTPDFNHLVLLIGTNPLPNFVVADYFLQNNPNIEMIWLVCSEKNPLQAGTNVQAENLEKMLKEKWEGTHKSLQFPLEKVSLSDVSHAKTIKNDLQENMLTKWKNMKGVHLNYTGGTKSMSTHIYWILKEEMRDKSSFSYLDARNFRLIDDDYGVLSPNDLRTKISISFEKLIELHGLYRCNKDRQTDFSRASEAIKERIDNGQSFKNLDGKLLEDYVFGKLEEKLKSRLNNVTPVLQNWEIKKDDWRDNFELDVILVHGYQLIGTSCTASLYKKDCKNKGFEIILRARQIGGDEAKMVLITGLKSITKQVLEQELAYYTGGSQNILVLGRWKKIINQLVAYG